MRYLQFAFALMMALCYGSQPLAADGPVTKIRYNSWFSGIVNLHVWSGTHIAIATPSSNLDEASMAQILEALDQAYIYYATSTNRTPATPTNRTTYEDKLLIAVVPKTNGAACGYPGVKGIEIETRFFDIAYNEMRGRKAHNQILFYELGRNFWFWDDQLGYKSPDRPEAVRTGFAVLMRVKTMEVLGIDADEVRYKQSLKGLIDLYTADKSLKWHNTFKVDVGVSNSADLGAADLFASMMLRLEEEHGPDFIKDFWHTANRFGPAASTTQAVDNFIVCACMAAKKDLTPQFKMWRWPVSRRTVGLIRKLSQNQWQPIVARR